LIKAVLLFVLGLICLIKGGDWFVYGAISIAQKLKIPEFIIGATVVSIGTTLPEVMVSATSALGGHGEIAYGNAIGSVICNTALIAALTIAVKPAKTYGRAIYRPMMFFFGAAAVYCFSAYILKEYPRAVGILLLAIFIAYILSLIFKPVYTPEESDDEEGNVSANMVKVIAALVVGAAVIAVGADLLVDNGTLIAIELGVPESVIALTFVALGTSLPELVTAITALIKGHSNLSLGNIVGANLFNLVLVSGLSITLCPFGLPEGKTLFGVNASLVLDIPLMVLVMLILTVPAYLKDRLTRAQGVTLLCIYAAFVAFQFLS